MELLIAVIKDVFANIGDILANDGHDTAHHVRDYHNQ